MHERDQILQTIRDKQKSHSIDGLEKFTKILPNNSNVLDVGSGPNEYHAKIMRIDGHNVETCDFHDTATIKGNFNEVDIKKEYDGVWSSHCLEHQLNVNLYLRKISDVCKDNGYICITVPPLKHTIVGGHTTLWNPGLVLYNMILAGLDCSHAMVKSYGYNISVIVQKKTFEMPNLHFVGTDLALLKEYFPKSLVWKKGGNKPTFQGDFTILNW